VSESEVLGSKTKPLLGTDEATIDAKGRILISKKKRDRLGDGFAICIGENGCLNAFPAPRWEQIISEIDSHDPINHGRRQYTRLVLGTADDELNFDDQGRVVVPQKLRAMAKLNKEVVIVGCGDRLEIWAREEYDEFLKYPDTYGAERRESIEKAYREMKAA
jgi:MraZ protein